MENNLLENKYINNQQNYIGIDYFRIAAAILVIAIHTSPLLSYSKTGDLILVGILARVAVPFFFMATGFFLFSSNEERGFSYSRFLQKNGKLYGVAVLLFLPLSIYAGYFDQAPFFPELLKDIFFNGTFYHLWYFPAVILGVGAVTLILRYVPFHIALPITFMLYLIGLFGDSYYGFSEQIPFLRGFYHILFQCFDYTRNGLFFAPFYFMLGIYLSKKEPLSRNQCILGLSVSLPLMVAEGLLLHLYSQPRHDSMYFALIPSMYFLFQLLLLVRGSSARKLRSISLMVYLFHPLCIVFIRGFAKAIGAQEVIVHNSVIFFLVVTIFSIGVSVTIRFLWGKYKNLFSTDSMWKLENKGASRKRGRAWTEISCSNLRYNLEQLENVLPQGCRVMAVVKADAYGHGAVPIATELQESGVSAFAVATLEEGILLRKNRIQGTVLILGYTHPQNADYLVKYHLVQTVVDHSYAVDLNHAVNTAAKIYRIIKNHKEAKITVHLKIDTGMHRLGEGHENLKEITDIFCLPNLALDGMFTHLCVADSLLEDDILYTRQQLERFYQVAEHVSSLGYATPALHIQSSYGILNYPELHCGFARIGIALYGALSQENEQTKISAPLKPVLSMKARISIVKELGPSQTVGYGRQFTADRAMRIATITIGYADGIPRNLTGGRVLIHGKSARIIGRICMDQLTVDITQIPDAKQGDIATIIGQDGNETISAEQLAKGAGTITNELFSRLGDRLERIYI